MIFTHHARQVVLGRDEDGETVGNVFIPIVETPTGQRFEHCECIYDELVADAFVSELEGLHLEGVNVLETKENEWSETDPAYGSSHHQQVGDFHLMDAKELECK